ncbi:MAG TPA: LuxR family transcriptional regulator [Allosphingosinicella sp.]|uniref:helix-turn-helix transcriptional regulator n=1 Tax=Allosphingosinicella sp. TaxID=2823234 RepID=UPI002ED84CD7
MADLRALVENACNELGFDYFAIVHHIRFGRPTEDKVRLTNYPSDWIAILREEADGSDPVLRAAERTSSGFTWEQADRLTTISERDKKKFKRAAAHGLVRGYTVPNHVPGETFGSCHFVVKSGKDLPKESLPAAQALGCFAFEAARQRLQARTEPSDRYIAPVRLTDRQRDCVLFAARGKSDSVIAELLNLRPRTVNEHIEAAKRRYAVATRTQLIVRALFRSEICYSEVID